MGSRQLKKVHMQNFLEGGGEVKPTTKIRVTLHFLLNWRDPIEECADKFIKN